MKARRSSASGVLARPEARLRRYVEAERAGRAQKKYDRERTPAALDAVVEAYERAVAVSTPGDSDYCRFAGNLAVYLQRRFNVSRQPDDIDAAIIHARQALDAAPLLGPQWPRLMENLAIDLHLRYGLSRGLADLETAVHFAGASARATSPRKRAESAQRWARFENYVYGKFEVTGNAADLDAAIDAARKAVAASRRAMPAERGGWRTSPSI